MSCCSYWRQLKKRLLCGSMGRIAKAQLEDLNKTACPGAPQAGPAGRAGTQATRR